MPTAIVHDLDNIISEVSEYTDLDAKIDEFYKSMGQPVLKNKTQVETVVIFDLVESTLLKVKIGHDEAMRKILLHDKICRVVVKKFNGHIVKETGDGLMVVFENPLHACLAAINVLEIATRKEIPTKAALVLGLIEKVKVGDRSDVFGIAVDMCSHIEKCTSENQILINKALYDAVLTFLKNYDDIFIGKPMSITLKAYGKSEIYEISSKQSGLKNCITLPFQNSGQDRLTINEKIEFIQNTKFEIIEVGSGFLDFITHFKNSIEFIDFVRELLKKGINIKCMVVDPDWISEKMKFGDCIHWENFLTLKNHLVVLKELQKEFNSEKLPGYLEILVYKKLPLFSALCIDSNHEGGRMIVSNYLHGIEKSENPEIQFLKTSNPIMFNSYLSSIIYLMKDSNPW